ncbi:TIGR02206 family membrane protein [Fusobacterium sp.]|uniref:YwaF family protein n=1 Tax=Fusobacterium sp. TaxID=68766 RepID=UPI00261E3267|nr:TIGR02206 family membrane protein [Fusobacterium sp.]
MQYITLFSLNHILYILFFIAFFSGILYSKKFFPKRNFEITLALVMAFVKIITYAGRYFINKEPLYALCPIHICNISFILAVIFLIFPNIKAFQLVFYMSLGAIAAILFPEAVVVFPNPFGISFFLEHFFILFMIAYQYIYLGFRPNKKGLFNTFITLNILAVLAYIFNNHFSTNYMFVNHKPITASPLDYFGPWPFYILVVEFIFIGLGYLVYLLFNKKQK